MAKVLPAIKQVKFSNKKEFVIAVLDKNIEAFLINLTPWLGLMLIHLVQEIEIFLLSNKIVTIPNKYLDFTNSFLDKKSLVLLKIRNLNKHVIKLLKDQ